MIQRFPTFPEVIPVPALLVARRDPSSSSRGRARGGGVGRDGRGVRGARGARGAKGAGIRGDPSPTLGYTTGQPYWGQEGG